MVMVASKVKHRGKRPVDCGYHPGESSLRGGGFYKVYGVHCQEGVLYLTKKKKKKKKKKKTRDPFF